MSPGTPSKLSSSFQSVRYVKCYHIHLKSELLFSVTSLYIRSGAHKGYRDIDCAGGMCLTIATIVYEFDVILRTILYEQALERGVLLWKGSFRRCAVMSFNLWTVDNRIVTWYIIRLLRRQCERGKKKNFFSSEQASPKSVPLRPSTRSEI
jgi:hypothetical protein